MANTQLAELVLCAKEILHDAIQMADMSNVAVGKDGVRIEAFASITELLKRAYLEGVKAISTLNRDGEPHDKALVAYDALASLGLIQDQDGKKREDCLRILSALGTVTIKVQID